MTPDWAASPIAVPYARFDDPQTLNLYSYGRNNPLSHTDDNGHFWQELGNWLKYGHWVDDKHLEGALKQDAQRDLADLNKRGVTVNGTSAADLLKGKTNQQIVDAYSAINSRLETQKELAQLGVFMTQWGWNNSAAYRQARAELEQGGNNVTHEDLNGKVPTREEATRMIEENGGEVVRQDQGHDPGGVSTHTEPHINYRTSTGFRQTVIVKD